MADGKPPAPRRNIVGHSYGVAFGAVLGIFGGLWIGLFALYGAGEQGCARNYQTGIIELAAIFALMLAAWLLLFRAKGSSFTLGLLRGSAVGLFAASVAPWPCSLGWWAVAKMVC